MNILITGGTSAVGSALVTQLANRGHRVVFTYCHNDELARQLHSQCRDAEMRWIDFTKPDSVQALADDIAKMDVDVLINNAYVGRPLGTHFHRTDPADFDTAYRVNIKPVVSITQACIAVMRRRKAGMIITIGSMATQGQVPAGYSVYAATKAYLQQLAHTWHSEYAHLGIRSMCVLPDFMATALHGELVEHLAQQQLMHHSRLLNPSEVAQTIARVIDGEAAFRTDYLIDTNNIQDDDQTRNI